MLDCWLSIYAEIDDLERPKHIYIYIVTDNPKVICYGCYIWLMLVLLMYLFFCSTYTSYMMLFGSRGTRDVNVSRPYLRSWSRFHEVLVSISWEVVSRSLSAVVDS